MDCTWSSNTLGDADVFSSFQPDKASPIIGRPAHTNILTSWACGAQDYGQLAVLLRMLHSLLIVTIHKGLLNSGQTRDLCCDQAFTGQRRNRRCKGLRGSLIPLVAVAHKDRLSKTDKEISVGPTYHSKVLNTHASAASASRLRTNRLKAFIHT